MPLQLPDQLEQQQVFRLVNALLECDCMKTPQARESVLQNLPKPIADKVKRFDSAVLDVESLVRTCRQFVKEYEDEKNGIEELFTVIQFYERGESQPWKNLQKVTQQIIEEAQAAEKLNDFGMAIAQLAPTSEGKLPAALRDQIQQMIEAEKARHGQTGAPRAQVKHLDEVMHHINFTRLRDFLAYGERHYTQDGFAALCVLQQSTSMGGRWGLKCIQEWLEADGRQPKEIHLQPLPGETLNAARLSQRLAREFGATETDTGTNAAALAQRICGSFHQDRRILITIQPCNEFSEATWQWLLHEFWCALIHEFAQAANRRRVRLMMVLQTDHPLTTDYIIAHCCDTDAASFDRGKLVRLPLDCWTKDELLNWLTDHWSLNRTDEQLQALAADIYAGSHQGLPLIIHSLCKERLL